jgi:hypothetical protein
LRPLDALHGFFDQDISLSDQLRTLRPWLGWGLAASLLLTLALLALVLQRQPRLSPQGVTPSDRQLKTELIRGKLRSQPLAGREKEFVLTADDLKVAADLALSRKHLEGVTRVRIKDDQLDLQASIRLPQRFSALFLNIVLIAENDPDQAIIRQLKIGDLSLHDPYAGWAVNAIMKLPPLTRYGQLLEKMLMKVHMADDRVTILLKWNREFLAELGGLLTEVADRKRMIVYQEKLVDTLESDTHSRFVRLGHLMKPLFTLAYERSLSNQQAIEENRAVLLVLSAYTNGKDLSAALGTSAQPPRRSVLLNRRVDTAKHFMGAAAMAMSGQGTLVEMIGLAKELHDTHDGSGFSFIDLAADEAGALLGKYAVRSPEMAFRIQERLSQGFDESPFIPAMDDLPESMNSEEFARRFKAIGSPEYDALKKEINMRIMALPVFQFRKTQ